MTFFRAVLLHATSLEDARTAAAEIAGASGGASDGQLLEKVAGSFRRVTHVLVSEHDRREELADRVPTSPHVHEAAVTAIVVGSELPLDVGDGPAGALVEVDVVRVVPGRWRDALDAARAGAEFHRLAGATRCRLWHLDIAGSLTRALVATNDYPDAHVWASRRDAAIAHPDVRHRAALMQGDAPPLEHVTVDLYRTADP